MAKQGRDWAKMPVAERVRLIEEVAQGKRTFASLYKIPGITEDRLRLFIGSQNYRWKMKGVERRLPDFRDLRADASGNESSSDSDSHAEDPREEERVFEDHGNVGIATLTTCFPEKAKIHNLLKTLDLDLSIWEIERAVPNSWQTMTSVRGVPEVITLYQMKVYLRRKIPVFCEWPTIAPVVVRTPQVFKGMRKKDKPKTDLRCCLVIPDSQNGYSRDIRTGALQEYHDRRAWDIACQLAQYLEPDMIVLVGDHCDLPEWSDKFMRTPDMYFTTQPMLLELHWWLAKLRGSCPESEIVYIEGNHEARMSNAVTNNLIASWGLKSVSDFRNSKMPTLSIPNLLDLENLQIRYEGSYPEGELWVNDNLKIEHGNIAKNAPQETARAILARARSSVIFGHIHRREVATKNEYRKTGPVTYMAECFGCICHTDGRVPANDVKNDWNQGLGVVWYQPGNGLLQTEHVHIHNGSAIYDQRVFKGEPNIQVISDDCGWKF